MPDPEQMVGAGVAAGAGAEMAGVTEGAGAGVPVGSEGLPLTGASVLLLAAGVRTTLAEDPYPRDIAHTVTAAAITTVTTTPIAERQLISPSFSRDRPRSGTASC
jgi:hypothetical protein